MAYITSEQVAAKRKAIRAAFPAKAGWKISVRMKDYSKIMVTVLKAPHDIFGLLTEEKVTDYARKERYIQTHNLHHKDAESFFGDHEDQEKKEATEAAFADLQKMYNIMNEGNYNNSDAMTDYFDVGFYTSFDIGDWDKPFEYTGK